MVEFLRRLSKFCFKLVVVILAGTILYSFQPQFPQAQEGTTQTKSEPVELNIDAIYQPCENPSSELCVPYPSDVFRHPDPAQQDHELGLSGDGFPPNTEVYLVGCINTTTGPNCTSGSSQIDNLLNSALGGDQMNPQPDYQFKALENPIKSDAEGIIERAIVRSYTPFSTKHYFNAYYLVNDVLPTATPPPLPTTSVDNTNTLNQGTVVFETTPATPSSRPRKIKMPRTVIRDVDQDPKGRFFDAKSLEPLPDIEVALLDNAKKLFNYSKIINPQKVKPNGEFNFWVPNGIYYLEINSKPVNYLWPIPMETVHPNYSLAYFCDPEVKDEKNQTIPAILYNYQHPIFEYNKLVHCDVPLDPGNNQPYRSEVTTVEYGYYLEKNSQNLVFSGKTSHPLTTVIISAEKTKLILYQGKTDRLGYWKTKISSFNIPLIDGVVDRIVISYKKTDLTKPDQEGQLSTSRLTIEPILSYIEGYAFDENGQIIANARVGIRQINSTTISYLTYADAQGYFRIPSKYLPTFPYEIIFTKPDNPEPIAVSASVFTQRNSNYLKQKGINLATARQQGNLNALTSNNRDNLIQQKKETGGLDKTQRGLAGKNAQKNLAIIVTILFILTILIVVLIVFIIKKRKSDLINAEPPVTV